MRRMLSVLVAGALVTAGSAAAAANTSHAVLPSGIHEVTATVRFPAVGVYKSRKPIVRTFESRAKVGELVTMVDSLHVAAKRAVCPMMIVLGPTLTLVFRADRAASSPVRAEAEVQVALGTRAHSGGSPCFPIRLTVRGRAVPPRVSATFVRAVGRLMRVAIS